MADQVYVRVENVLNPSVKRTMTLVSARINAKKWRIIEGQVEEPIKKKEGAKVAGKIEKPVAIIPVTIPIEEPQTGEFEVISDQADEEAEEIEKLRVVYQEKTGKPADKRWKKDKLTAKIAEL